MNTPDFKPLDEAEDLLAELEESIPQGVPNSTHPARRSTDPQVDALDELDSLLAESMQSVEQDRQYKADRAAKAKGYTGLTPEEVAFCNSRMAAFEMAREWDAQGAIGVFTKFTCANCGCFHVVFSRWMEFHKHRRNKTASRWLTVPTLNPAFADSLEYAREDRAVETCDECEGVDEEIDEMRPLKEVLG